MSDVLVELRGITKRYGHITAVTDVSLSIHRGEFVVLLGPSGSGKTTLLSTLGGFIEPTVGTVLIAGRDVTFMPPSRRPTVTVFQDYALFPHMNVQDNVAFGLVMRRIARVERRRLVNQALATVGLEGYGKRRIDELSGGQRQRVALARAIVVEPAVLLLDEPLGALDLRIRKQMQDELVRLQRELRATFVHVTHDQEEAMSLADTIVLMNAGRIEDLGPPERIYLRPATRFAATFMGDSNILSGRVAANEAGILRIDTPIGQIGVSGSADPGTKVHVSIRPERIGVLPASGHDVVTLGGGVITEILFQGTHRRARIRMDANGTPDLTARVPVDIDVAVGDRVTLQTRTPDMILLRD